MKSYTYEFKKIAPDGTETVTWVIIAEDIVDVKVPKGHLDPTRNIVDATYRAFLRKCGDDENAS